MKILSHTPNIILFTAPSPAGDNPKKKGGDKHAYINQPPKTSI
jgi:hypothetical protein